MFGIFSDKKSMIPTASEALPGRSEAIAPPAKHYVNGHPMSQPYPAGMEMAMFGIGCFWGAERKFWQQEGVYLTAVGYAAGPTPNPSYQEVCTGMTGHNEVVLVVFDPIHCPLNEQTKHIINTQTIGMMKEGLMLINTSRGALVDTMAVIQALKTGRIGYLGLDVYEQEEKLFFNDLSENIIQDDVIMRLLSFPNVLITSHQGFFTEEALTQIAQTTLGNVDVFEAGAVLKNLVV